MRYYTGVGSRETPEHILKFMQEVSYWLASQNYIGRSGSAGGADAAFEKGFFDYKSDNPNSNVTFEAYLPWNGFSDINEDSVHIVPVKFNNYKEAIDIASNVHPVFDKLTRGAKALHTRNVYQVLGKDLKTPSRALFCYAKPTKIVEGKILSVSGGTNTAVQIALKHNVPVYNFYLEEDIEKIKLKMKEFSKK